METSGFCVWGSGFRILGLGLGFRVIWGNWGDNGESNGKENGKCNGNWSDRIVYRGYMEVI